MKSFVILFGLFGILSLYCVYEQVADGHSISLQEQKLRHENFLKGESDFFNPWQYRVLSPYLLEGTIYLWDRSIAGIGARLPHTVREYFPFLFLRFIQNIVIFFAAFAFYKAIGIKNKTLILTGILLLGYNMSNSTYGSDLSINTYFDVLFYLLSGYVILQRKNIWIIPLTFVAALNRETSAFIPLMFLLFNLDFRNLRFPSKNVLTIFSISVLLFVSVYIGTRWIYGLREYQGINDINTPWEFLWFNLTYGAFYPEMFGVLGFGFVVALLRYNYWSHALKLFFWLIVPFWFGFHLIMSQAMETRLFLVPQALIFVPALLYVIEFEIRKSGRRLIVDSTEKVDEALPGVENKDQEKASETKIVAAG